MLKTRIRSVHQSFKANTCGPAKCSMLGGRVLVLAQGGKARPSCCALVLMMLRLLF